MSAKRELELGGLAGSERELSLEEAEATTGGGLAEAPTGAVQESQGSPARKQIANIMWTPGKGTVGSGMGTSR